MRKNLSHIGVTVAVASFAFTGVASAEEIQGQKGMSGGATALAKGINVSQSQLDKAGNQGNDWLHTNGNYDQTR